MRDILFFEVTIICIFLMVHLVLKILKELQPILPMNLLTNGLEILLPLKNGSTCG